MRWSPVVMLACHLWFTSITSPPYLVSRTNYTSSFNAAITIQLIQNESLITFPVWNCRVFFKPRNIGNNFFCVSESN